MRAARGELYGFYRKGEPMLANVELMVALAGAASRGKLP